MDELFPTFSPNGKWIAYITFDNIEETVIINIVRRDGTEMQQIASGIRGESFMSWAPDSNSLIYVSEEGAVVSVEIDSGEATTLTAEGVTAGYPAYAP